MTSYYTLNNLGDPIEVEVLLSARSKRISVHVSDKVKLIVPENAKLELAYDFLRGKEQVIRNRFNRYRKNDFVAISQSEVKVLGKTLKLEVVRDADKTIALKDDKIFIGGYKCYKKVLKDYLKEMLFKKIEQIISEILLREQFTVNKISVKELSSIWGSCSSKGNLSFNWRLVFVPIEVLNYVIIHELCHLKEMNHGARFWQKVRLHCPDYKDHIKWLRERGSNLGVDKFFR